MPKLIVMIISYINMKMRAVTKIERSAVRYFFGEKTPNVMVSHTETYTPTLVKFRMFACFLLTINAFISFFDSRSYLDQIIYLTSIGFQSAYLFFMLSLQYYLFKRLFPCEKEGQLCLGHLIQIVYEVAFSLALPITAMFWSVLMKDIIASHPRALTMVNMITIHALPFILLSVDLILNNFDFYKKRLLIVVGVGAIYLAVNLAFTVFVHKVYPPIDWVSISSYVMVLITLGLLLCTFFLGNWVYRKYKKHRVEQNLLTQHQDTLERTE